MEEKFCITIKYDPEKLSDLDIRNLLHRFLRSQVIFSEALLEYELRGVTD